MLDGIRNGFDTGFDLHLTNNLECKNLLSARRDPDFVNSALEKECALGYIKGPYKSLPFSNYRVSPIGVAIGKYSGKKRLIIDLSHPRDSSETSVNESMDKDNCSVEYI